MDRLFLDANILYSAAHRSDAGLLALWRLAEVELITSDYALVEATRNLPDTVRKERLDALIDRVTLCADAPATGALFVRGVDLPEKDWPILLAAIQCGATHLLTGDMTHFGPYFNREIEGVLILTPAEYLRSATRG